MDNVTVLYDPCAVCVRRPVGEAMLRDRTRIRLCEEHWETDLPVVWRHRYETGQEGA